VCVTVFGEDALVNVSVEKQPDGKLAGYIRIRSKTQGIALSLGDKCARRPDPVPDPGLLFKCRNLDLTLRQHSRTFTTI